MCNGWIADILRRNRKRVGPGSIIGARASRGLSLSIPNLITLARIMLVPVVVWAIAGRTIALAFLLFLAAAISDGVDGFLAKRFGMKTELGAYLDPLADKVLIVSIYVTLGITGVIPLWIVILVVSRDFMIVGAIILSWVVDRPVKIKPHIDLQAQHRRADRVRLSGAGLLWLFFRCRAGVDTGDGAGRGIDLAFGRPLSRRMDASHEFGGSRPVDVEALGPAAWCVLMAFERQVMFWIAALAVLVAVLWLLSDVLLPFVAGMALAYLLDPSRGGPSGLASAAAFRR